MTIWESRSILELAVNNSLQQQTGAADGGTGGLDCLNQTFGFPEGADGGIICNLGWGHGEECIESTNCTIKIKYYV